MKKVLVTGCRGFIGKALVVRLQDAGYQVTGIDAAEGDITEPSTTEKFLDEGIEYVFHLAGRTFIPDSWKDPFDFYRVNLLGTASVLEFCRKAACGLTFVSSYVYGDPDYLPVDENHPLKPYNPYTHSKILAEELCSYYKNELGVESCIFRPFNIYGPGQPGHFLIPEITGQMLDPATGSIEINDMSPRRDFLYLDDFISALIISPDIPSDIYNIGSGISVSIGEIISIVSEITGIQKKIVDKKYRRTNEIYDLYANIDRIRKTGWTPAVTLAEGIGKFIRSLEPEH